MTIEHAIGEISVFSKPGDWHREYLTGYIRHTETHQCPICWLASLHQKTQRRVAYWEASSEIGLSHDDAQILANIADGAQHRFGERGHTLRAQLVSACHLSC